MFISSKPLSHQQVTCLTLFDLSAAFDTIDHSIILKRLPSWFGIPSTALFWIKSYLLNRSFYVDIENSESLVFQLLYGVPQASVLGPLYSSSYTPPLSVLSYLILQQTTNSMPMILNFSDHSLLWISLITSLTLKIL